MHPTTTQNEGKIEIMAHEKQYVYKVSRCAATISRHIFACGSTRSQIGAHINRGHLSDLEPRVPPASFIAIEAKSLMPYLDISEESNIALPDDSEGAVICVC